MEFNFFILNIEGDKESLLCNALAEVEEMNYERLIGKNEVEEIEAISEYHESKQLQLGFSHDIIEEDLFITQINQLFEIIEWFNRRF